MWALWMNNNISKGWNCGSDAFSGLASSSVWTQLTLTPSCPTLQTHAPNSQVIAPFLHVDPWKRIRIVWDLGIYSSSRFHYIQPGLYFNGSLFISTCPPEYVHNTLIYTLCTYSQPSDSWLSCPLVYRICCVLFLDLFTSGVLSGPGPINSAKVKASALHPSDYSD